MSKGRGRKVVFLDSKEKERRTSKVPKTYIRRTMSDDYVGDPKNDKWKGENVTVNHAGKD